MKNRLIVSFQIALKQRHNKNLEYDALIHQKQMRNYLPLRHLFLRRPINHFVNALINRTSDVRSTNMCQLAICVRGNKL